MTQPDFSPAADNNKQVILDTLRQVLGQTGRALEIASGTGQHVTWFARHLPGWRWQPSDANPDALASIAAYTRQMGLPNVLPPLQLDVTDTPWLPDQAGVGAGCDAGADADAGTGKDSGFGSGSGLGAATPQFDAIYCANMLHISPWASAVGLMQGSARHLTPAGVLVTYGPYLEDGVPTAPSNLAFDASLRARHPGWGIRRREALEQLAARAGLQLAARHAMPVNNLLLVWTRVSTQAPAM